MEVREFMLCFYSALVETKARCIFWTWSQTYLKYTEGLASITSGGGGKKKKKESKEKQLPKIQCCVIWDLQHLLNCTAFTASWVCDGVSMEVVVERKVSLCGLEMYLQSASREVYGTEVLKSDKIVSKSIFVFSIYAHVEPWSSVCTSLLCCSNAWVSSNPGVKSFLDC